MPSGREPALEHMSMDTIAVGAVLTLLIASVLVLSLHPEGRSFGFHFVAGLAFQFVLALAASVAQTAVLAFGLLETSLSGPGQYLLMPFLGVPFNLGGFTVAAVFEATVPQVETVLGERTDTVMSLLPYYLALVGVQTLVVGLVLAWRCRSSQSLKDRFCLALGGLLLANALLNVRWPWWGT